MINRMKVYGKAALVLAMVASPLALYGTPASASHASTTVDVGVANNGSGGEDAYDDSDLSGAQAVMAGTGIDFFFDNGNHNVIWVSSIPAPLADSAGLFQANSVGTTFSVTMPSTTGTYIYFCGIHSDQAEALSETDFSAAVPNGMYGRIEVAADSTAPVWSNGNPVTATPDSASQITLGWPAATDNSGSVFFDVYQNTVNNQGSATLVGDDVNALTYAATGLSAGGTYYFWVIPVDGTGNAAAARSASATTSSIAASAAASAVVAFSVSATLSVSVTPSVLDLGTLSPAAAGTGTATVTVGSNGSWSMNVKSIGRNGLDDAPGDDAVFTADGAQTIPVSRATWDAAGSGATALSDTAASVVTAQAPAAAATVDFDYSLQPLFTDPEGTNYRTTVLYTVTQP